MIHSGRLTGYWTLSRRSRPDRGSSDLRPPVDSALGLTTGGRNAVQLDVRVTLIHPASVHGGRRSPYTRRARIDGSRHRHIACERYSRWQCVKCHMPAISRAQYAKCVMVVPTHSIPCADCSRATLVALSHEGLRALATIGWVSCTTAQGSSGQALQAILRAAGVGHAGSMGCRPTRTETWCRGEQPQRTWLSNLNSRHHSRWPPSRPSVKLVMHHGDS